MHKNKNPLRYFNYGPIVHRNFDKHKNIHFKRTFENKVQFWLFKSPLFDNECMQKNNYVNVFIIKLLV